MEGVIMTEGYTIVTYGWFRTILLFDQEQTVIWRLPCDGCMHVCYVM